MGGCVRSAALANIEAASEKAKGPRVRLVTPSLKRGRSERIRTFDPLIPNQMRYQAALRSDKNEMIAFYLNPRNRNYWMPH
jgi:hypothetical protein